MKITRFEKPLIGAIAVLSLVTLTGCPRNPPVADFDADITEGPSPLVVEFYDLSDGGSPNQWIWNFGDGTLGDEQNPVHTYDLDNITVVDADQQVVSFAVTLTVINFDGADQRIKAEYITVYRQARALIKATPDSGRVPLTVEFINISNGNYADCDWDFGDGTVSEACGDADTIQHVYEDPGEYWVVLHVTGDGGADLDSARIVVSPLAPPVADFEISDSTGCRPFTVVFNDRSTGSVDVWNWDFGDSTSSTDRNPAHTYQDTGTFDVTLITTGPLGSDTATSLSLVAVFDTPVAAFSAFPEAPLVVPENSILFANESSAGTQFDWNFGDGETTSTAMPEFVTHTYSDTGIYTVSLTATNACASDEFSADIFVPTIVRSGFTVNGDSTCAPATITLSNETLSPLVSWTWTLADGSTSFDLSPTFEIPDPGTYSATLTVAPNFICDSCPTLVAAREITVLGPPDCDTTGAR